MSSSSVLAVSTDADRQLKTLKALELISFLRSLSWSNLLNPYIEATDGPTLLGISEEIEAHRASNGFVGGEIPSLADGLAVIREYLRDFYSQVTPGHRNAAQIIADIHRVWEARTNDGKGRADVGAAIDTIFLKRTRTVLRMESPKAWMPLTSALISPMQIVSLGTAWLRRLPSSVWSHSGLSVHLRLPFRALSDASKAKQRRRSCLPSVPTGPCH